MTLSNALSTQVTVQYEDAGTGTATSGSDYTAISRTTLTFAANATSRTFSVAVQGDTTDEPNETVKVKLLNPSSNAVLGTASTGTGTITNDDADPTVTLALADSSISENGGSTTVTATLSHASSTATTITVTGVSGFYTAGTDATISIAAGSTSNSSDTATINAVNNTTDEPNRTVTVTASVQNTNGAGSVTGATLTLEDDDAAPTVTLALTNSSISESGGSTTVTATLSHASSAATTITVTGVSGFYTAGADATIEIAAGSTANSSDTATINAVNNTTDEPNRTVTVTASVQNTQGRGAVTGATLTLTDDDAAPTATLTLTDSSISENGGSTTVKATLSNASSAETTITVSGVSGAYTVGAGAQSKIVIAAGDTTSTDTATITAVNNTTDAPNRTVTVAGAMANTQGMGSVTGATLTITDDDAAPTVTLSLSSSTIDESGTSNFANVTATLSHTSSASTTITISVPTSTDYTVTTNKTLTVAAGSISSTGTVVTITAANDNVNSGNKTVTVSGSAANTQGVGAVSSVTLTIRDDEGPPLVTLVLSRTSINESGANNSATVTATLNRASTAATSITVSVSANSPAVAGDFTQTGTMLNIAAGATTSTGSVTIAAANNNVDAANKTLTVSGSATNSVGVTNPGNVSLTIADDDSTPTVTLALTSASISENGSTTVTATLSHPSSSATTLTITVAPVLPAVAGDFSLGSNNTLTIAAGSTSSTGNVTISAVDNDADNLARSISVSATAANTHGIAQPSAVTLTITDDDVPTLSFNSPSVTEGATGSTATMTFTVSLSPASLVQVTVDYADAGTGTATAGADYATITGSMLTFAAGETSKSFDVTVNGDESSEGPETVIVSLSNASPSSALSSATATGTGTIVDDDRVLSSNADLSSLTISEGELSPEFASGVTNYAVVVGGNIESLTVTPTVSDTLASGLTVNGNSVSSGSASGPVSLATGENTVSIVVTAEDGTQKTYAIAVTRTEETVADRIDELDTEIVTEVAREVTTSVVNAVSSRVASMVGGTAIASPVNVPATDGFTTGGLLSILVHAVQHDRERERGLQRSEMSLYRSLDGASFVYSPSVLSATGSAGASGGGHSGILTVWGSVDYRKMSGSGEGRFRWDGELASLNIGTDTMSESGVLIGLAAGVSKGSFGYQSSTIGSSGVLKMRVKTLNPYVGWSVSESASLWASVGYGKGKINYNDNEAEASSSKMSLTSAALGGRYRLFSVDDSADGSLIQVSLKGEAWGLQNKIEGGIQRPMGLKYQAQGMRIAVERHRNGVLESGASLVLLGEAGVRWDGGDGDTGAGFEMGGTADYSNSATGMKLVATTRVLVDHESDRKEWGAGLTVGSRLDGQETGMTYRYSLSHGQAESGVGSLWNSSAVSRTSSEEKSLATRLGAEVGYRMHGMGGLYTPYVGFGVEADSKRDYRVGIRYVGSSAVSSGLEFERREARSKRPDHRVMLTGQMSW